MTAAINLKSEGNSIKELESTLIDYEKGSHAFIVPSGTSAIAHVLMAYARPQKRILVVDSVYYKTRFFCQNVLEELGVKVSYYPPDIGIDIDKFICPNTTLIFCESPGSWTFEIQDIPAISKVARQHNIIVATDNSWATPVFCQPLSLGADIVIESLSKYILGHGDLTLGAIITNKRTYPSIKNQVDAFGIDDWSNEEAAQFALLSLKTLRLRLHYYQSSALQIIDWLKNRKEVSDIFHPIYSKHQNIWRRDFTGSSGLFSILLKKIYEKKLNQFIKALKVFKHSYGWGSCQSLIHEAENKSVIRNYPLISTNNLIRLSIGLEKTEHLIKDLNQAFDLISA